MPGRVRLLFQPAEETMPGGALMAIDAGALEGVSRDLRPARRPHPRRRHRRAARGPADRGLGPPRRDADRQGRAHLAAAPDRGPHLRPRQAGHRAARGALAPAGPPLRASAWCGGSCARAPRSTSSPTPVAPAAPCGCSTPRPGPAPRASSARSSARSSSRTASTSTVTYIRGVPPVVNEYWSTTLLGRAVERSFGDEAHVGTTQSLGGEDFAWYLDARPRRDGPPRHAHARRSDVRPPPG